jgi:DDE superfamily endonuclease
VRLGAGPSSAPLARRILRDEPPLENEHTVCQIGVFLGFASRHGHVLIDRALYLPADWANDADRRREARIPAEIAFATKLSGCEFSGSRSPLYSIR